MFCHFRAQFCNLSSFRIVPSFECLVFWFSVALNWQFPSQVIEKMSMCVLCVSYVYLFCFIFIKLFITSKPTGLSNFSQII